MSENNTGLDLSTEELLRILEEASKNKQNFEPDVNRELNIDYFINTKNIKSGVDKVPNYLVYYSYKNTVKEPYGLTYFFRLFSKKFESYRIGKQRYYLLDKSSFDFSREGILNAQKLKNEFCKKRLAKKEKSVSVSKKRLKHET